MSDYRFKQEELFPKMCFYLDGEVLSPSMHDFNLLAPILWPITGEHKIQPIPITAEILESAGFEKAENGYFNYNGSDLHEMGYDDESGLWEYYFTLEHKHELKYFHELQARIFWDSNREIMLKLWEKKKL